MSYSVKCNGIVFNYTFYTNVHYLGYYMSVKLITAICINFPSAAVYRISQLGSFQQTPNI